MPTVVGVFREAEYSPGKVADDAAILERTAAALTARGLSVRLGEPALALADDVDAVLAMCQSAPALAILDVAAARVPVMNGPAAIRHCFRTETVRVLADAAPFPPTRIVATDTRDAAPAPAVTPPCWVKRGDVHAMERDDVVFAADAAALDTALARFRARGIAHAAVQAHVAGTVVKFYGLADGRFFRCYAETENVPAPIERMWTAARTGAAALGLDVFGGDLVVTPDGEPVLIDVNDWPSFARCRDEAAAAIAGYVADRLAVRRQPHRAPAPRRAHA
jgi:hypothetical protein